MLEEVLLAGERSRELDDDVSTGRSSGVDIGPHPIQASSVFLSTRFEEDAARERIGRRRRGRAERRGSPLGLDPFVRLGQLLYI